MNVLGYNSLLSYLCIEQIVNENGFTNQPNYKLCLFTISGRFSLEQDLPIYLKITVKIANHTNMIDSLYCQTKQCNLNMKLIISCSNKTCL